jgi:hypothetical protein
LLCTVKVGDASGGTQEDILCHASISRARFAKYEATPVLRFFSYPGAAPQAASKAAAWSMTNGLRMEPREQAAGTAWASASNPLGIRRRWCAMGCARCSSFNRGECELLSSWSPMRKHAAVYGEIVPHRWR